MEGRVAALHRYPVKGFTPERLGEVMLEAGGHFPQDRLFAVERGPSGFDPAAPVHLSKWRFTVLANHPRLARTITAWDVAASRLTVRLDGAARAFDLGAEAGRTAFADWLAAYLGPDEEAAPLRLVDGGAAHRFTDDPEGLVSLASLSSVEEVAQRLGREIDPLRLRSNIHVSGWPPWAELDWTPGTRLRLGGVVAEVVKPIPRCIATHVDPATGERDLDLLQGLRAHYGHVLCGVYVRPLTAGRIADGDPAGLGAGTETGTESKAAA
jgi:uncharacterized protein YcbX